MFSKQYKLRKILTIAFALLGIPFFISFIAYSYFYNYNIYTDNAKSLIQRHHTQVEGEIDRQLGVISNSISYLKLQITDDPGQISNEKINAALKLHLDNNPDLVSIFIASNIGTFRQVQRIHKDMIIAGRVPAKNSVYNLWTFEKSKSGDSYSKFDFFDASGKKIDSFTIKDDYEPRARPFYKSILKTLVSEPTGDFTQIDPPFLSRSTKRPTLTLSAPVVINGEMTGMIGESFELTTLSNFLKAIRVSPDSQTYVLDTQGNVLFSGLGIGDYKIANDNLNLVNINERVNTPVEYIAKERSHLDTDVFEFMYGKDNSKYLALLTPFEKRQSNRNWQILTIAPERDFLIALNRGNYYLIIFSTIVAAIMMFAAYKFSKALSRPIENLTTDISHLLDFKGEHKFSNTKSNLYEIKILSQAIRKLKTTIDAFTSYVPRDLVNDLLNSGNSIEIGGESRYVTIFFSDLENFSGLSEQTPTRELLARVSAYLKLFTYAIKEESGTVDKFIGDSVMAFWGAPLPDHDHAYHACRAALKAQKRMETLNETLVSEGKPKLRARIGIHSDAVLVGNIGSTERLSYTVMGDGVNIASRLEGVNKGYATGICISHAVYKEAGEKLWVRPIDQIVVKGRKAEITIYELVGIRDDDPETSPTESQIALCLDTQKAFNYFVNGEYGKAAEEYAANADRYSDQVSVVMAETCRRLDVTVITQSIAYDAES